MSEKFLAAVDGSEHGWKALDLATELANISDAELLILHVIPHEPMPEGLKKYADVEGLSSQEIEARHHLSRTIEPAHKSKIFAERLKKTQTVTANSVRTWNIVGNDIHLRYGLINYWPVMGQSLNFGHTDPSVGRLVRKVSSLSANVVSASDS